MDTNTHEIRLANWKTIVEQCAARPAGQTVKQWLEINGINDKQYFYWQRKVRQQMVEQMELPIPATCQKSEVTFAQIHVEQEQDTRPVFIPAAVIKTERATIEISAFAPVSLTNRILKAVAHAV